MDSSFSTIGQKKTTKWALHTKFQYLKLAIFPFFFANLIGVLEKALQYGLFPNVTDVNKQANNKKLMWCPLNWPTGQWVLTVHYETTCPKSDIQISRLGDGRWRGMVVGTQWSNTRVSAGYQGLYVSYTRTCSSISDTDSNQDVLSSSQYLCIISGANNGVSFHFRHLTCSQDVCSLSSLLLSLCDVYPYPTL